MKTKTIEQKVTFKASPHEVYEALMDSKLHSRFTGGKAVISRKPGGEFNAYDNWIEGVNLELVPDRKIVQRWRGADWPKGHFSTATFELEKKDEGSELIFTQKDVPDEYFDDISKGWKEHYWDKMKKIL